jgi:hypothetical protein
MHAPVTKGRRTARRKAGQVKRRQATLCKGRLSRRAPDREHPNTRLATSSASPALDQHPGSRPAIEERQVRRACARANRISALTILDTLMCGCPLSRRLDIECWGASMLSC